ncbi:hypothetical protein E4U28_006358 [Claviceps purpurea]|nr:hypothetical protein E4U28_006358 [Claviceps purpurea]
MSKYRFIETSRDRIVSRVSSHDHLSGMLPHHGSSTENFKIQPKRARNSARKASQKQAKEKRTVDKENMSPEMRVAPQRSSVPVKEAKGKGTIQFRCVPTP